MQKIANFIMSRKFIPVILVLTGASFFLANRSQGNANSDDPRQRYQKILRNTGILLEEGHVSPRKVDDEFSKLVLAEFLKDIDPQKGIFLKADVDEFTRKYGTVIDDEIHNSDLKSFFEINERYQKRQDEVIAFYTDFLKKPIDFTKDEMLNTDPEKYDFPKDENARKDFWRKTLKLMVLEKYSTSLDDRAKGKGKKDFVVKADTTLEREAREAIKKQMARFFTTKKSRESSDEIFSHFVNAITGTMDPHTNYFPPIDLRSFNESMRGSFYGIGAQLKEEEGKIKIGPMQTGMPAQKSGQIVEGDEILKVGQGDADPVDVTGYSVPDAVKLIRGEKIGSVVKLTLKGIDGRTKVVALKRDKIDLEETFVKSTVIRNGKNKLGYIYLPEFYTSETRRCATDVAKELEKLKAENVDGIILDLRSNGGGSLYDVVEMVGLFIEDGPVVQVKNRNSRTDVLRDKNKGVLYSGPLAVMLNEMSASASEIFAAAIQDYKRGIIIGSSSSYGKGTVQRNIPLNPQSESGFFGSSKQQEDLGTVKLTLQKFYRINGDATQRKGVVPDIILPSRYDYLKIREKDVPSALPYDEIRKAEYTTWTSTYSIDNVIKSENESILSHPVFGKIKTEVSWLEKNADKEYSLNLVKYKKEQEELRSVYKNLDTLTKLSKPMDMGNLKADEPEVNMNKEKQDKNKDFMKLRVNDLYIDETVKILSNMIALGNIAKNE